MSKTKSPLTSTTKRTTTPTTGAIVGAIVVAAVAFGVTLNMSDVVTSSQSILVTIAAATLGAAAGYAIARVRRQGPPPP